MRSLAGNLLVASPYLENSPFARTVVLVLQHNEEAAWGLVLNRLSGETVPDFWKQVTEQTRAAEGSAGEEANEGGEEGAEHEPADADPTAPAADDRLSSEGPEDASAQPTAQQEVNVGGPIAGPVLAVHRWRELAEAAVPPGVFVATDKDRLQQLIQQTEHPFRLFVGLSGWTAGQLEHEIEAGAWLTLPASVEDVFGDAENLWGKALREVGHAFTRSLGVKHIPEDVSVN